jgi:hypothetical protein
MKTSDDIPWQVKQHYYLSILGLYKIHP